MFTPGFGLPLLLMPFFDEEDSAAGAAFYCGDLSIRRCAHTDACQLGGAHLSGNSAEGVASWHDAEGGSVIPNSATYQVFDRDGAPVSGLIDIADLNEETAFVIDGAYLDSGSRAVTKVGVQVVAEFDDGTHTSIATLSVRRRFS